MQDFPFPPPPPPVAATMPPPRDTPLRPSNPLKRPWATKAGKPPSPDVAWPAPPPVPPNPLQRANHVLLWAEFDSRQANEPSPEPHGARPRRKPGQPTTQQRAFKERFVEGYAAGTDNEPPPSATRLPTPKKMPRRLDTEPRGSVLKEILQREASVLVTSITTV